MRPSLVVSLDTIFNNGDSITTIIMSRAVLRTEVGAHTGCNYPVSTCMVSPIAYACAWAIAIAIISIFVQLLLPILVI